MKFDSDRDVLSTFIIFITSLAMVVIISITPFSYFLFSFIPCFIVIVLLMVTYKYTYYELKEEYLLCNFGFRKVKIYYNRITNLERCENRHLSLSLSKKRILVVVSRKGVAKTYFISPKDRTAFLEKLIPLCKNLHV